MSLCSSTVTDSLLHLSVRNVGAYCDQIFVDQNRTSLLRMGFTSDRWIVVIVDRQ